VTDPHVAWEVEKLDRLICWLARHRLLPILAALTLTVWAVYARQPVFAAITTAVALAFTRDAIHRHRRQLAPVTIAGELEPPSPIRQTLDRPARALPPPTLNAEGLTRIRVGTTEKNMPWELNILGTHILIAGETGAGKSSVIWSTLDGLGPYIRCGLVQVWAIDPKLGLELTIGKELFARYEYTSWSAMASLLDDAVKVMHRRALALAGVSRKHQPTTAEPLLVVLVDEMTVLTEIPDAKVRKQIDGSLFALLAQGRAAGVVVVGAGQDIRKERLPDRHMFPTKIALRIEKLQVDMLLGDGARERGALCDQIPRSLPGTGYVMIDDGDPVRVRSYWLDDGEVRRVAELYRWAS
jgi:hypothetical protein